MSKFYEWCGGRKIAVFYLLLSINLGFAMFGNFNDDFANFCILLGGTYVLGNVTQKGVTRSKNEPKD